jgi:hypothetical protein
MIQGEKRRVKRPVLSNTDAHIEIEHTYGKLQKTAYKILEYGEFGLSFLVPAEEGYFLVGTPLKFTIVHPSSKFRRMYSGAVRYYHPVYQEDGQRYYKTGVEIVTTFRDLQNKKLHIRAERIVPSDDSAKLVRVLMDNHVLEFTIADVSKYSAALFCDEADLQYFNVSSIINIDGIVIKNQKIFQGTATIIRIYHDNQGNNRVVFQPRNTFINTAALQMQQTSSSVYNEIQETIKQQEQFNSIDVNFKTAVADARIFLETMKEVLDKPQYQTAGEQMDSILKQMFPDFFTLMDSQIIILDDIVNELELSQEMHLVYKKYFQHHLLPLLLQSPFNHICYFKPNGYPGDFEMMRLNHENEYEGPNPFARILSKYTTECHFGEVARKRTEYLYNAIYKFLSLHADEKVSILSIASGPALEVQELIRKHPEVTHNLTYTLLDQEIKALQYSMEAIYEKRIKHNSTMEVNFIHDNIQNYLRETVALKEKPQFDIIYSFGLFDYFDLAQGKFLINSLKSYVKPGGQIFIANASLDNNHYKLLMEFGFDWYLVYRNKEEMKELAKGNFLFEQITIDEIEKGTMKFLKIQC